MSPKSSSVAAPQPLQTIDDLVDALAERWKNDPTHVLIHAFPLMAQGRPVQFRDLAERSGLDERKVAQVVRHSRAIVDSENCITSLFGVGFVPSAHRIDTGEATLYSCCGLVAQTVAQLTGTTIRIRSADPISGKAVELHVAPGGLLSVRPDIAKCIFARSMREDVIKNPYEAFCRHVRYCESDDTADRFARREPGRFQVTPEECNRAATRLVMQAWGTRG